MPPHVSAPIVQQAIQLAIAPVFLLTGIAALLGVMATRLARIIDRARDIEQRWSSMDDAARSAARVELATLERRRHVASWAINFCTGAALLVCIVIVTLFFEEFLNTNLSYLASALFVISMLALIAGLSCFLREVYVATQAVRINERRMLD